MADDLLDRLEATIRARRSGDPDASYVARLTAKGRTKIAQKVGEEAVEVALAAVGADRAAVVPEAAEPAGWPEIVYVRLHGSPEIYYSNYDDAYLDALAERLRAQLAARRAVWCVFDNTALGAAWANARTLLDRLRG